ncbi:MULTISPECIES: HPP family protein [unclassified Acinetobacter]|uniref:HPP family protein n=1 Tax=unclassified Acinetobacter TaxID=196816 RepID=UPI002934A243|nr:MULTISPECIES: HPP family protein [unclassified Acinetobacter]WOE30560.1 HPP family protein [Acinetobacter sp. SAAs470]WOE38752.1 HPP family protein [Acinetobacter sp. SAAs474]
MLHFYDRWLNILKPNFKVLPIKERLICGMGALLGLALSSFISWLILGDLNPWYIAPMGASSVLLFAIPASPLAQPWNMLVGNIIAAIIGITCALYIVNLTEAFSVAVALSIILMMTTDALHPPSGAVAITAVLGGSEIHHLGYFFVLYPVLLNSVLLIAIAIIFNQIMGKRYPEQAKIATIPLKPTPMQKATILPQDIQQAFDQQTELLDISEYDLANMILKAQKIANMRLDHGYRCQDIMTRQVISLAAEDHLATAVAQFKQANLMSLPVVTDGDRLVGTLALSDVMDRVQHTTDLNTVWHEQVYQIMNYQVITVTPQQPLHDLIEYFVERSFNYIPVVEQKRLVGIISRADMIAALHQQFVAK